MDDQNRDGYAFVPFVNDGNQHTFVFSVSRFIIPGSVDGSVWSVFVDGVRLCAYPSTHAYSIVFQTKGKYLRLKTIRTAFNRRAFPTMFFFLEDATWTRALCMDFSPISLFSAAVIIIFP